MSDAVATSTDGNKVILTCQEPTCGATSAPIPITPRLSGTYWCGVCGEWAFDFDIVGLTEEETWPDTLDLVQMIGPLGPDGVDTSKTELLKVTPIWKKP